MVRAMSSWLTWLRKLICSVCGLDQTLGTFQDVYGSSSNTITACLPLTTDSGLCAIPPGTISSDGLDDVCVLVACCNGGNTVTVQIPSGSYIACLDVNYTSVCDLSNIRSGLGNEACDSTCTSLISSNECSDPKPNTCNFYSDCLESRFHCGSSGYPIGYGLN